MKYLVLIYRNPESRQMWEAMSDSDRDTGLDVYRELNAELAASGELVATEALTYPEDGRQVVRQADGSILIPDALHPYTRGHTVVPAR